MNYGDAYISTMIEIPVRRVEYIQDFQNSKNVFAKNRLVKAIQDPLTEAIEEIVGETALYHSRSRNPDITLAGFLRIQLFQPCQTSTRVFGRATDPTIQKSRYSQEIQNLNGRGQQKEWKIAITLAFWAGDAKTYELGEAIIKERYKNRRKIKSCRKNNQEENEQSTNTNENKNIRKNLQKKQKIWEKKKNSRRIHYRKREYSQTTRKQKVPIHQINLSNVYPDIFIRVMDLDIMDSKKQYVKKNRLK